MHGRATTALSTAAVWSAAVAAMLIYLASLGTAQTIDNGVTSVTSSLVSLSTSDTLNSATITTPTSVTESTYATTVTTCFMPASGTSAESPVDTNSALPVGAECIEVIRSNGSVFEFILYSINSAGSSVVPGQTSSATASSSSSSSTSSGTIAGAVVGSVLGAICLGIGTLWLRKQRRSNRASGQWFHNSGGWVRDEKSQANVMEMTPRGPVV